MIRKETTTMKDLTSKLEDTVSRRDFTVKSALALLSGVAITIVGCNDSDSPMSPSVTPTPPPTTPTTRGDVTGAVSANHGHAAEISGAELAAGNSLNLDITGRANHPHTVNLSANEITQIANGQRVTKAASTNSAHDHDVTFN
jgi:hypothetical protein